METQSRRHSQATSITSSVSLDDNIQEDPPSYRDIMPRRAWLPPGAAASSLSPIVTTTTPVPMSPTSPHSPVAALSPLTAPTQPAPAVQPPRPLTPDSLTPPPVPPPATPKRVTFAYVRLIGDEGIRMAGFPVTLLDTLETTLQKGWKGVRDRRVNGEVYDWTLDGAPWSPAAMAFASHRLLEYIFFTLSKAGWQLAVTPTLSGHRRDAFFFRSCVPRERVFFTVMFEPGAVLLLDAPLEAREVFREVMEIYPSAPPTEQQPRVIRVAVNVEMGELSSDVPFALLSGFEVVGYEVVATFDILARLVPGKLTPGMLATGLGSDSWVFASK